MVVEAPPAPTSGFASLCRSSGKVPQRRSTASNGTSRNGTSTQRHLNDFPTESEVTFSAGVVAAIIDAAAKFEADVIFMGDPGRTGVAHVMLESTAEGVIHAAPPPSRSSAPACTWSGRCARRKDGSMYRRIMVTLDGSSLARVAIPQAIRLVSGTNAEVVVLQVIETPDALRSRLLGEAYEFTGGRPDALDQLAESSHFVQREAARDEVDRAAEQFRSEGISVTAEVVEGLAGNAILAAAERHAVDAIVMSTRGHGGLGREVVGSVAEYVLRHIAERALVLVGSLAANS